MGRSAERRDDSPDWASGLLILLYTNPLPVSPFTGQPVGRSACAVVFPAAAHRLLADGIVIT
jgi:hypothetical protein